MTWKICPVTKKRGYASKSRARQTARNMKERLRLYFCKHCHSWHMTKMTNGVYTRKGGGTNRSKKRRRQTVPKTRRPKADLREVEKALAKKEARKK